MAQKPIRIKKENRGKLRKAMKAKPGKKLSPIALKGAKKKTPKGATKKQVQFALNAAKWSKGKKKNGK